MTHGANGSFQKLVVHTLTSDFRAGTAVVSVNQVASLAPNSVLVRNQFVGINASDINFTAGKYQPGLTPPFDCGFEALGEVVRVGDGVVGLRVGQPVLTSQYGAFAEFQVVPASGCLPVPRLDVRFLPLRVSALTALVALEEIAKPKRGGTALVTAAAGGTGQFAVQLLKSKYGCTVIGTCSSDDKITYLKSIGCDRAINYKKEALKDVLKREYPKGVDIVYESVGGALFDEGVRGLAQGGKLIVIGSIVGYKDGSAGNASKGPAPPAASGPQLGPLLLTKGASVHGFFLPHFNKTIPGHLRELVRLLDQGQLVSGVDPRSFVGVGAIADAVEYLHSGANVGKVVVSLRPPTHQKAHL